MEYAPAAGTDYDGSMVPAEWYGWLHHKADETPEQVRGGGGAGDVHSVVPTCCPCFIQPVRSVTGPTCQFAIVTGASGLSK